MCNEEECECEELDLELECEEMDDDFVPFTKYAFRCREDVEHLGLKTGEVILLDEEDFDAKFGENELENVIIKIECGDFDKFVVLGTQLMYLGEKEFENYFEYKYYCAEWIYELIEENKLWMQF